GINDFLRVVADPTALNGPGVLAQQEQVHFADNGVLAWSVLAGSRRGFLVRGGTQLELGQVVALSGINSRGEVAGTSNAGGTARNTATASALGQPFLRDLPHLPGDDTQDCDGGGFGINRNGRAVGAKLESGLINTERSFFWDGTAELLPSPAGKRVVAKAISGHDQIVGFYD